MKKKRKIFLWLLVPVLCAGCRSGGEVSRSPGPGELMAGAVCTNDVKTFREPLSLEARKKFGEKEFADSREALCRRLGKPVGKTSLGRLRHPFLEIDLWRIAFERSGENGPVTQEALFQVVSAEENGQKRVISFGFL